MATKVKSYRIDIKDDAQIGDAIVIGQDGGMTSSHLGSVSCCDIGVNEGNIPVLGEDGKLSDNLMSSSVMKKDIYDQCCCNADAFNYENFYNTPTIPEVFDPIVTFTQGGITKGSISLNQASPTVISLDAGGVTAGCAIDINNSKVSVKYDGITVGKNNCNEICVVDYDTIKCGAACGASAVQANDLATVAMTGNYCDLINKPEIPSAQIQSDWEQCNTSLPDYIKNKPTIGNATITLQKNGTDVDTFTLNQTANKCLNLTLNKCDVGLNNVDNTSDADKPISTATQTALNCKQDNITDLNTIITNASCGKCAYDTIGNYGDIVSHNVCEFATATQGGKADTAVQPGDLATVATSGKYCDLSGQPTIPTDNCQLTNSCGYITNAVNNLQNYYLKCETYQKCEVDTLISNFGGFEVVSVLPTTNIKTNVIYLLGPIGTGPDKYEEWIYYNNTWTKIGETTTDLSNYAKCCDIPTDNCQLGNSCGYTTCTGTLVSSDLEPYAKSCDLKAVATSGKYCDLTGTPTLATVATSGCYNDLTGRPLLCAVAISGCYSDLSGTPSLATVATSGCYNDLTGTPTIPTDNCQLGNSCNYITKDVTNLTCYTPTNSLSTVATSGAYCDLTGTPTLACVACSGCYDDLSGKPNLGVYQITANMVCTLVDADNSHYPSAKTVADALSCAGAGDMLSSIYDPCSKQANAFDYNNFINTPNLCAVATSGKYCDLSDTPTIPAALTAGCATTISSNKINVNYDGTTIKKNSGNCLYADFTGLATTSELACKADSNSLCAVATSGKYCDLTDTPSLATVATSGCYTDLTGTPTLCTVATSGKYCDLSGKPSLCTVATSGKYCDLTDTPSLATVATSGCYCDLSGTPTIPTVDTRTFVLSSTSDTTNASNAVAFINNGGDAIILYNNQVYILSSKTSTQFVFKGQPSITAGTSSTSISQSTLTFTASGNVVSNISSSSTSLGSYIETNRNYNTAFTPTCAGHPATKQYVDCAVGSINSAEWGNITGTLSCQTDLSTALNAKANSNSLCTVATSGKYCDLTGAPSLCAVATSGKYCDLTGTPTIPAEQIQSDWTQSCNACKDYIKNKPSLCTVATSGKYCDLTNTPALCTVATSGKYCDLTGAPTLCTVATSGKYCDLSDKPSLCTVATSGCYNDLTGKPSLCAVATSGCYCDLSGAPAIPSVGNATITLTQGGNSIGCFTTNSSTATTIDFEYGICYICCACASCYANCCDNRTYMIYETT